MEVPPEHQSPSPESGLARQAWSLLRRNRDFRLFFIGELISLGGDWFLLVALSGLILSLTKSPALVTALFVAYNLPYGFVAFIGGPLADRLDRRKLMIVTNAVMGLLALGFFAVDSRSTLWIAYILAAGISCVSALFEPAASASVPNLVDREDLAAANVLSGSAWGTMLAVGAGIGGLVVTIFGIRVGYMVDALSFFLAGLLLVWVRRPTSEPREPHHEHPGLLAATREAVSYSRRDRRVMALFASRVGTGIALGMVALLPIVAIDLFHAGRYWGTSLIFAFRGIGSFLGPFLIRPLVRRKDLRRSFAALVWLPALFAAMYALLPWAPGIYVAAVFALLAHLAGGASWTLVTYSFQSIVPDRVLGRIFGFDGALITFMLAGSNALCGWLAGVFGVRAVMTGVGVGVAVYSLGLWLATRRLRRSLGPNQARPSAPDREG